MKRIILHWSAGGHTANATDKRHYHFIVEGDGTVVAGNHAPEANLRIAKPNDTSTYAAHTSRLNTGSIGVALAAMRGAKERPFDPGPSPITPVQFGAMLDCVADLCRKYDIPVQPETVLSHAEVEATLGLKQAGKWDITWVPTMDAPGDAREVGNRIRKLVKQRVVSQPLATTPVVVNETPFGERQNLRARILQWFLRRHQ